MKIQLPAIIDGVSSKKDRSLTIKLGTPELNPQDTAQLFNLANSQVWIAIADEVVTELDIPDTIPEFKNEKSLSERLRNVLYVYWKQQKQDTYKDFESFRKMTMERLIAMYREKLD